MIRKLKLAFLFVILHWNLNGQNTDSTYLAQVYHEILQNGSCHEELHYLCKKIGNRVAGSLQAMQAIEWSKARLQEMGADTVYLMPVSVPTWKRGKKEEAHIVQGRTRIPVAIAALGGSVPTSGKLKAKIIVVTSLTELQSMDPTLISGKIVFINKPLDASLINTGAAYSGGGDVRRRGPAEAEKKGAVGCITRSLTLADDQFPHTGATDSCGIPCAAISAFHAKLLQDLWNKNQDLDFEFELTCSHGLRTVQYNVIGEIRGSQHPEEIITVGGHLDSWDIGEGAHDDGAGCVQSMEVLRSLKSISYKPNRTIRVVLFINEEFGNDGGITYAKITHEQKDKHLAAIESDGGGFTPRGFSCQANDSEFEILKNWMPLYEPYLLHSLKRGWSGVDIAPLKDGIVTLIALNVDNQRYFDYHHTANDIWENVNKRELELGAAAMASLVILIDQHFSPLP
jgi:carboxypeptidase Q